MKKVVIFAVKINIEQIMRKFFMLCLVLLLAISANAQSSRRAGGHRDTTIIRSYMDSLSVARSKTLGDTAQSYANGNLRYSPRMFGPATYYHDIVRDAFTPGLRMEPVSLSLLSIYMSRPDLISNTQTAMDEARGDVMEPENPIVSKPSIAEPELDMPAENVDVPVDVLVIKPRFWTYKGDYALQFMQNYVSDNWYKGGESNYAALGAVTMEANFNNRDKVKWDNKLELKLGMQSSRSDSLRNWLTTEDLIRLTSKYGLQATKKWYYTLQLIAQTQFTRGLKTNDPKLYSHFLAPGMLNLSLGMDYNVDWINHHLKGTFHLAPLAYNMRYTRLLELSEHLGIDPGKHFLHDLGSLFTIDLTWEINESLRWKTRMYGYTTYKRVEYEWENTFVFQFNKWISAQLFVYPRFDDNVERGISHGYWQFKEFASIGFQYVF